MECDSIKVAHYEMHKQWSTILTGILIDYLASVVLESSVRQAKAAKEKEIQEMLTFHWVDLYGTHIIRTASSNRYELI